MTTKTTKPKTRTLYQCPRDRSTWPTPQITPGKRVIVMTSCPQCGRAGERVGSCQ